MTVRVSIDFPSEIEAMEFVTGQIDLPPWCRVRQINNPVDDFGEDHEFESACVDRALCTSEVHWQIICELEKEILERNQIDL